MDQFGYPVGDIFTYLNDTVESFDRKSPPGSYEELGVIETRNLRNKEIFVCFESGCKQRFYLAKPHQFPIVEEICKSPEKDVMYQKNTEWGLVQARGFKYSFKNFPVIGYVNDKNLEIYGIPMQIYGPGGNGLISRFEKGKNDEYNLYDDKNNLITEWPILTI